MMINEETKEHKDEGVEGQKQTNDEVELEFEGEGSNQSSNEDNSTDETDHDEQGNIHDSHDNCHNYHDTNQLLNDQGIHSDSAKSDREEDHCEKQSQNEASGEDSDQFESQEDSKAIKGGNDKFEGLNEKQVKVRQKLEVSTPMKEIAVPKTKNSLKIKAFKESKIPKNLET